MLEALLVDRFQLRFHRVQEDGPVFELDKSGGTLRLQQPKDKRCAMGRKHLWRCDQR